mmetsp:Transcript_3386/g.9731  ORF Transcript_3386/g.9731 Transcript_3386/m.9731 type:complete len:84 (-) Transcript_3386:577-828(-)
MSLLLSRQTLLLPTLTRFLSPLPPSPPNLPFGPLSSPPQLPLSVELAEEQPLAHPTIQNAGYCLSVTGSKSHSAVSSRAEAQQ